MVGFAGESQGFDGNGSYTRVATGGGRHLIKTRQAARAARRTATVCSATRSCRRRARGPTRPSSKPPYKPNVACYKNAKPNLNGPAARRRPPDRHRGEGGVR